MQKHSGWIKHLQLTFGGAILTVIWAHLGATYHVPGIQFIAGIGVTLFLMCSGYGLQISYSKTGINGFWYKKLMKICLPFWTVEALGLVFSGHFHWKAYIKDALFIQPATGYGWYMQYLMICYFIFWFVKTIKQKHKMSSKQEMLVFLILFISWFILDSLYFITVPSMPFLRSRQMLSFLAGIFLANQKDTIAHFLNKSNTKFLVLFGTTLGVGMIAITQLPRIKAWPYLASNILALFTVFPLASVVIVAGKSFPAIINNGFFAVCGTISFELYLVHAFTLSILSHSCMSVILFAVVSFGLAYALYSASAQITKRLNTTK